MCELLLINQFSMEDDLDQLDATQAVEDAEYCYILEIDVYMANEKHDTIVNSPHALENISATNDMSPTYLQITFRLVEVLKTSYHTLVN